MQFIHGDLGEREGGEMVQFVLAGNPANVRLLDAVNFERYCLGQPHAFCGGPTRTSPVMLTIPSAGCWHAVVDMQGLAGSVRASIQIWDEPPATAPMALEANPLWQEGDGTQPEPEFEELSAALTPR